MFYAKSDSDFFFETYHITIISVKKHFRNNPISDNPISESDYPIFRRLDDNFKSLIRNYEHFILGSLIEFIDKETFVWDLKQNSNSTTIESHIQALINKITNHYIIIISYLNNEISSKSQVRFLKLNIEKNNIQETIQILLDSTNFNGYFSFDFSKLYYSSIDFKIYRTNKKLKSQPRRTRYSLYYNELNKLNDYESSVKDCLKTPNLKAFLIEETESLKKNIGYSAKINYQFTKYYENLKETHKLLLSKQFISNDISSFVRALEKQEGKINWIGSKFSLIQFLGIIEKHTIILNEINFNEFICETFLLKGEVILNIRNSTKSHKKKLVDGKKSPGNYEVFRTILKELPEEYNK